MKKQGLPCVRKVSKGAKIGMWFGHNPQTDRGYLVGATAPTALYRFFYNIIGVLVMV